MIDCAVAGWTVVVAGSAKVLDGLLARDLARHGAEAVAANDNAATAKAVPDAAIAIPAAGARALAAAPGTATPGARETFVRC